MKAVRRIFGVLLTVVMLGALLVPANGAMVAAATPAGGTVTSTNPTLNYTGGPYVVANPSAQTGAVICNAVLPCDDFALTVSVPAGYETGHNLTVNVQWPTTAADFDLYVLNSSGAELASSATSSDPETVIIPAQGGSYTIRVVPFAPLGDTFQAAVALVDRPAAPPPSTEVAPTYRNYAAPNGLGVDAGEPSIGVNPQTGKVFFQSGLQTLRVTFNDSAAPATATWEDRSAPNAVVSLDPILFTDQRTGRTQVSQLTGQDSLSAVTDDDGETWLPSQGGGIPSGVDHQSVGAGPYSQALPVQLYPDAVYYCSQSIATAFCARSDDGGLTVGVGVPIYTLTECTGIHGHVKVAPDGTVYVPNRGCGGQQAVVVSTDNGLTWTVRKVSGSTPSDGDPSVGIGADGTVYFGYQNADGHPRVAVSHDRGQTWTNDQDVGTAFGIQNTVFPTVVAGDADRAAFAFLGTPTGGNYQDPATFTGIWHLYVAHTYDGGRTWVTSDATPNDPVQRGSICTAGTTCGSDRKLLDFIDITVDAQGRVLVGYADGCIGACVQSGPNSFSALGTIAREVSGKRLFAQFDQPDLTDTAVGASYTRPHSITLKATVSNIGTANAGSFVVHFRDGQTLLGESAPLTLAAGQTATATYNWNTQGQRGSHTITAIVDPFNRVAESNEANNQFTQTLNVR
jgi:hypothetical protein